MFQSKKQNRWGALGEKLGRPGLVRLVAFSLLVGLGGGYAAIAHGDDDESSATLSGTWRTTVTLTNCGTGVPLPIPNNPFPALNTFLKNGTMLETGSRSLFRSPGHGTWERTGRHEFMSRWMFFRFAPDGSYIGTQELTRTIRLTSDNAFTAAGAVTLRDPAGNVVGSGCNTETGERF